MDKNTSGRGRVLVHPDKKKDTRNRSKRSSLLCLTQTQKKMVLVYKFCKYFFLFQTYKFKKK